MGASQRSYNYLGVGFGIFLVFALLAIGGFDIMVNTILKKVLALTAWTPVWTVWTTMPLPIHLKFYFFNVTNPDELKNGSKAILTEMGPYVYLEDWEKEDVSVNDVDGTIRYRMSKKYFFQPELSKGSEDDVIHFINIIFLATAALARQFIDDDFLLSTLDDMLIQKGETLVRNATVKELLFDGMSVKSYIELFENDIVAETAAQVGLGLPEIISDGRFAIFKGKNGTNDGWLVVHDGVSDSNLVGEIISHNDKEIMSYWRDESCNTINGTDGTFFRPFITQDTVLHIFSPLICRSLELGYLREGENSGIDISRFIVLQENFMTPEKRSENWCFCPKTGFLNATYTCVFNGVFNIAPCVFGAPLLISNPHFYGADPEIANGVEGLSPDFEKHVSFFDFHALSGSPIEVRARFQFGIELLNHPAMPSFMEVQNAIIPLGWLEEGSQLEGMLLFGLKFLDVLRAVFVYVAILLMLVGAGLMGIGVSMLKDKSRPKSGTVSEPGGD